MEKIEKVLAWRLTEDAEEMNNLALEEGIGDSYHVIPRKQRTDTYGQPICSSR